MPRRRWTIILVPPDPGGRTRRISFAPATWRTFATLLLAGFGAFGIWEGDRARRTFEAHAELATTQRELAALTDTVRVLRDSATAAAERAQARRRVFMPVNGSVSSNFARRRRHPVLRVFRAHQGVDVAAPAGSGIIAPSVGVVKFVGWRFGYGRTVEIDHGGGVVSLFAHCRTTLVKAGQRVEPGQRIATVGASGLASGPHLHFEVRLKGRQVDPLRFLARAQSSAVSFAEAATAPVSSGGSE